MVNVRRVDFISQILKITDAEKSVLIKLLEGASIKETAEALNLSVKTIEIHRTAIYSKIGGKNNLKIFS